MTMVVANGNLSYLSDEYIVSNIFLLLLTGEKKSLPRINNNLLLTALLINIFFGGL